MRKWFLLLFPVLLIFPLLCHAAAPGFMKARMGTLSGQVLDENGAPLTGGGVVSFFKVRKGIPPLVSDIHRIPDMLGRMDSDGKFSLELAAGTYYMGAMVITKPGRGPGPPQKGEKYIFARDAKGALLEITIEEKEIKDAGKINGGAPGSFPEYKSLASVEGKVMNEEGKPFEGAFILLKTDINSARPDYVSPRTGKDGHFLMRVPPGKYFLLARETIVGGRPKVGDLVGVYGKDSLLGGGLPGSGVERLGPGLPDQTQMERESAQVRSDAPSSSDSSVVSVGPASIQAGSEAVAIELKEGETLRGIDFTMYKVPDPVGTREMFMKGGQEEGEPSEFPSPFTPAEQGN